ncbi:MAG: PadR family transcriptional regulator [Chloroflexota bacterium]|nr:PadR family transcriptional regulator [Chloroflexota bacterium]
MRPALIEGAVEPALLALLGERDSYGYELASEIERRNLVSQRVPPARVYEVLRRLEGEGAVACSQEASPAGPHRRRYSLTPTGRDRLDRWVEALRMTEQSLRALLDTYNSQQRGYESDEL